LVPLAHDLHRRGAIYAVDPGSGDFAAALLDLTRGEGVDVIVDYVACSGFTHYGPLEFFPGDP
jgi:hypothetical protein